MSRPGATLKNFARWVLVLRSMISERRESAAVIRGIVALAHELGIPTTAEGIETHEQLSFVRASGCTSAQGFFLGRSERADRILQI